jgi:hypothetical protein
MKTHTHNAVSNAPDLQDRTVGGLKFAGQSKRILPLLPRSLGPACPSILLSASKFGKKRKSAPLEQISPAELTWARLALLFTNRFVDIRAPVVVAKVLFWTRHLEFFVNVRCCESC